MKTRFANRWFKPFFEFQSPKHALFNFTFAPSFSTFAPFFAAFSPPGVKTLFTATGTERLFF